MNALQSLVPNWLRKGEDDMDEYPPPPLVAMMPLPAPIPTTPQISPHDEDKMIFGRAAVMLEQLKRDREAAQRREQELQVQVAEALLARQADVKKIEYLELDNAELRNNLATMQTQIEEYRTFMSKVKQILDRFGIKPKPKAPRKSRRKIEITETPSREREQGNPGTA